jgi:hypothetical protein
MVEGAERRATHAALAPAHLGFERGDRAPRGEESGWRAGSSDHGEVEVRPFGEGGDGCELMGKDEADETTRMNFLEKHMCIR